MGTRSCDFESYSSHSRSEHREHSLSAARSGTTAPPVRGCAAAAAVYPPTPSIPAMAALHALAVLVTGLLFRNMSASAAEAGAGEAPASGDWDMFSNGLSVMYGAYQSCEKQADWVSCLKVRALRSADRALRMERVPLVGGLSFVKEEGRAARGMSDAPAFDEAALPRDAAGRQRELDHLLMDRIDRFFKGHSLRMDAARLLGDDADYEEAEENEAEGEDGEGALQEGRRKKGFKKYGGALLLGLMMKGGLMAMAWKGVALMAGKALMVAKIALVLSAIVALKKLSHGGHGEEKTYSTGHDYGGHFDSSGGGGGGGHYKRSLDPAHAHAHIHAHDDAHLLAYSAHPPYPHIHLPQLELRHSVGHRPHHHHHHHEDIPHFHYQAPEQAQQAAHQDEYQHESSNGYDDAQSQDAPVYPYPQQ